MNIFRYVFFILIFIANISCSEYSRVLNNGSPEKQLALATKLYDNKKYQKAISLFEKLIPFYTGKKEMERIQYMVSQSHYNVKMYSLSAYYFDKFTRNYPNSPRREEASFLAAHSNYLASPVFSLDQKLTVEAIDAFQKFINNFPTSKRISQSNEIIKELNTKLERKAFEIAHQYYRTRHYLPAITAFERFLADYLGSSFKEDALYFRFLSGYELAMSSVADKKSTRIQQAINFQQRFAKAFPDSKKLPETIRKTNNLKEEIVTLNNTKNNNNES